MQLHKIPLIIYSIEWCSRPNCLGISRAILIWYDHFIHFMTSLFFGCPWGLEECHYFLWFFDLACSRGWQPLDYMPPKSRSITFHLKPFSFSISEKLATHCTSYQLEHITPFFFSHAMSSFKSLMVLQGLMIKSKLSSSVYFSNITSHQWTHYLQVTTSSESHGRFHFSPKGHALCATI